MSNPPMSEMLDGMKDQTVTDPGEALAAERYEAGMYKCLYEFWEKRATEYQAVIIDLTEALEKARAPVQAPIARIQELETALQFYADGRRYQGPNQQPIGGDPYAKPDAAYIMDVTRDNGSIAIRALRSSTGSDTERFDQLGRDLNAVHPRKHLDDLVEGAVVPSAEGNNP